MFASSEITIGKTLSENEEDQMSVKGAIAAETRQEMTISSQNVPQNAAPFSSQNYELED